MKGPRAPRRSLRLLIAQLPVILWTTDRALCVTSLRGAGLIDLDLWPDRLVGQRLAKCFEPCGREFPLLVAHRLALEGRVTTFEQSWRGRAFEVCVEPLRGGLGRSDGPIDGALGIALDITGRARMEEESARLAAIVESSDDAIIGKTLDATITSWNAGAERLYGYTAREVIGRSIDVIMPGDRAGELQEILARLARGERIAPYETVRVRKDGARVEVAVAVSPIKDRAGRVVGASSIARDVTVQKRLERALREAAALRAVASLAVATAHEINNPLTVISGHLQLLATSSADRATREHVEKALQASETIHEIIARMCRVTRLEMDEPTSSRALPAMLDLRRSTTPA